MQSVRPPTTQKQLKLPGTISPPSSHTRDWRMWFRGRMRFPSQHCHTLKQLWPTSISLVITNPKGKEENSVLTCYSQAVLRKAYETPMVLWWRAMLFLWMTWESQCNDSFLLTCERILTQVTMLRPGALPIYPCLCAAYLGEGYAWCVMLPSHRDVF